MASAPAASFFDITEAAIRPGAGTVPVTSRRAYSSRSAGTSAADWATTAQPTVPTWTSSSDVESAMRKPGIASSLSSVPPVCARPRPDIFATGIPIAAQSGASASVVLSPTPPVECLSTIRRPSGERSIVSPDSTIAAVSACVSASLRPRKTTAIAHALTCSAGIEPTQYPSTSQAISAAVCSPPSRLRSIRSTARTQSSIGSPTSEVPGTPSQAAAVAPTSEKKPSWRPCLVLPGLCASSNACSREWSVDGVVGSQP